MSLALVIRENKFFLVTCALIFLLGAYPWVAYDQIALLLRLNQLNHPLFDYFFYYITFLGNLGTYAALAFILLVNKQNNRAILIEVSSFALVSAIVQGMKRILFPSQLRPIVALSTDASLHLVKGVSFHTHLSFPSGHAATIFTAACLVYWLAPRKRFLLGALMLLLATLVAYSRIYLCQHFYKDVYVGALIGTWTTTLIYTLVIHWKGPLWLSPPGATFCKKSAELDN